MPNTVPHATRPIGLHCCSGKILIPQTPLPWRVRKALSNHHCPSRELSIIFFIGATNDNVADMQSVEGMDGVCGIKIFMGSSTGSLLVHEQKYLENIFANTGGIIATHAEDEDRLQSRIAQFKGQRNRYCRLMLNVVTSVCPHRHKACICFGQGP